MLTFLSHIFINKEDSDQKQRTIYGILCGIVGIFFNIILFTSKFIVGHLSGFLSITADAFNNLSDAGSSIVTLLGFRLSEKKPDTEHPFGHGRIEYIAGLIVSCIILIMAYQLFIDSIQKIIHPGNVTFNMVIIFVLIFSIIVKFYMWFYNHSLSKKISSPTLEATATDSFSDTITTSVVLITTLIEHFTGLRLSAPCGLVVALFIAYGGIHSAKETISPLLGNPPSKEFIKRVKEIVLSYPEILGMHDLIVHDYGPGRLMISLHAEVESDCSLIPIHSVIDEAEHQLQKDLGCQAVIHMDPIDTRNPKVARYKKEVEKIINEIDTRVTIHDFRIVPKQNSTRLIFDVLIPFDFQYSDEYFKILIQKKVQEQIGTSFDTAVTIDVGETVL